jgi:hypothetical protein
MVSPETATRSPGLKDRDKVWHFGLNWNLNQKRLAVLRGTASVHAFLSWCKLESKDSLERSKWMIYFCRAYH